MSTNDRRFTSETAPRSGRGKGVKDRWNTAAWKCLWDAVQGKGVEMEFLRTDNPARYQELKLRAADTILKYTQAPVAAHVPQTMVVHWLSSPPTNGSDLPPARNDVPLIELRADTVDDDDAPSS